MGETEHGRHVFFIGVVVAGNAQKIAGAALGGVESGQDQVTVIVVTMEQKAVVSVDPDLPRQEADVLGPDGKDLTAMVIFKCQHLAIIALQPGPETARAHVGFCFLFFLIQESQDFLVLDLCPQVFIFTPDPGRSNGCSHGPLG